MISPKDFTNLRIFDFLCNKCMNETYYELLIIPCTWIPRFLWYELRSTNFDNAGTPMIFGIVANNSFDRCSNTERHSINDVEKHSPTFEPFTQRSKVIKKLLAYRHHLYYLTRVRVVRESWYFHLPTGVYCIPVGPFFHSATRPNVRRIRATCEFSAWRELKNRRAATWCRVNPGIDSRTTLLGRRAYSRDCRARSSAPPSFYLLSSTLFTGETTTTTTTTTTTSSSSSRRDKFPREDAPLCGTARTDPPPPRRRPDASLADSNRVKNCRWIDWTAFNDRIEASLESEFYRRLCIWSRSDGYPVSATEKEYLYGWTFVDLHERKVKFDF